MFPAIEHVTYIAVPPERVFSALTTAAGWDAWFTHGTRLDLRPGGELRLRWQDWGPGHVTTEDGGPILEVVPGEKFVFRWQPGEAVTTVSFGMEPLGPGTLLRLTESGYVSFQGFVGCATGWGEALTLLKFHLEHGLTYGKVP